MTVYFSHQKDLNALFDRELDIEKAINNAGKTWVREEWRLLKAFRENCCHADGSRQPEL